MNPARIIGTIMIAVGFLMLARIGAPFILKREDPCVVFKAMQREYEPKRETLQNLKNFGKTFLDQGYVSEGCARIT